MSVPHTGKLIAEIDGERCTFDGDRWHSGNDALAQRLTEATDNSPATHYDIRARAEHVLNKSGFAGRYRIVSVQHDAWPDALNEEGGID